MRDILATVHGYPQTTPECEISISFPSLEFHCGAGISTDPGLEISHCVVYNVCAYRAQIKTHAVMKPVPPKKMVLYGGP